MSGWEIEAACFWSLQSKTFAVACMKYLSSKTYRSCGELDRGADYRIHEQAEC